MSLSGLPVELLVDIGSRIQSSSNNNHILVLALTCRKLYNTLRPWIQERISVTHGTHRYDLLIRTLRENPQYGNDVRHLVFSRSGDDHENDLAFFLTSFPALISLHIIPYWSMSTWVQHCFQIILSGNFQARRTIRNLSIQDPKYTVDTSLLFDLISFPQLEFLMICAKDGDLPFSSSTLASSNLKYLDMGRPRYINQREMTHSRLSELVSTCPHLTSLACNIPVDESAREYEHRIGTQRIFSVEGVGKILEPLANRLTTLHLRTTQRGWNGPVKHRRLYGSPSYAYHLDLSNFALLRELCVSAFCYFFSARPFPPKYGICELLPPSLERLEIEYPIAIPIFHPMDTVHTVVGNLRDGIEPTHPSILRDTLHESQYSWLNDFAFYTPIRLPKLRQVSLSEDEWCPTSWYPEYIVSTFQLPSKIAAAFKEVGVEYSAQIRTDRGGFLGSKGMRWAADLSSQKVSGFPAHPGWGLVDDLPRTKRTFCDAEL
ncbi:hypothetical protein K505DRAFT_378808 [Melanomma pulvis-pyrius CBS 109.77]|uniref:F-box domain-containing protein n=1 Tax=Melanomma pulvis-pyrius CBS 109.77 TaxID=1314802 RepID=A0A6A6WXE2_9PLEO|nr:hypothetical protein K505DRAFT_378808 [Melanomma pulvis-pyrius CBS 109.77]